MDVKNVVTKIAVFGVESRKTPVSHHVYVIRETWSDRSENLIFRRYDEFLDFQERLEREFHGITPTYQKLDALPGTVSPDQISLDEVVKRVEAVEKFIKQVVTSSDAISSSSVVIQFLAPDERDIRTWGKMKEKYRKEKTKSPRADGKFGIEVGGLYTATRPYNAITPSEHSFEAGTVFLVVGKHKEGWWKATYNNNEGFVHESFLKKTEVILTGKVKPRFAHTQASAEICGRIFPTDEVSADSSGETTREMTTPSKIELKLHKTGDVSPHKAEEDFHNPGNAIVKKSHGIDERLGSKNVDSVKGNTFPMQNKALTQHGWTPQGLDEMNPRYKEKFMKINGAKKKGKGISENALKPQEIDQLSSKCKDDNVSQDGRKSSNPLQWIFKKKIGRAHRERSKSMGNLLSKGDEFQAMDETKEESELNNNKETGENRLLADASGMDEKSARKRSQTVSTAFEPRVWSDAELQTLPLKEEGQHSEGNNTNDNSNEHERDQMTSVIHLSNKVGTRGNQLQDGDAETSTDRMVQLTPQENIASSREPDAKHITIQASTKYPESEKRSPSVAFLGRTSQQDGTEDETVNNIPQILLSSTNESPSGKLEASFVCAKFSYRAGERGEVSFEQGDEMEVIRKAENGWWLVVVADRKGWAPSNFLMPLSYSSRRKNGVWSPLTQQVASAPRFESPESQLASNNNQRKPRSTEFSPSNSFTSARISPRNIYSSGSSPRFFTFETCETCSSCGGSPRTWSPTSQTPTKSPRRISRQLPSPPIEDLNIMSSTEGSYICDAECIASHGKASDGQEILDVASKEVVEVLYQDKRGYSLVRVPSKYGWVPTTCVKQVDT